VRRSRSIDFHEVELVDYANEALAIDFFRDWSARNPQLLPLNPNDCVGYQVPLFLGGETSLRTWGSSISTSTGPCAANCAMAF
jgi:hypothetical protein